MTILFLLVACGAGASPAPGGAPASGGGATAATRDDAPAALLPVAPGQAEAVFAGGCFWCMESDFDKLDGVVSTTSGYAGGHLPNPTYRDVTSETTGHKEAVRVVYDTARLSYTQLLDYYWRHVDPTDAGGQFCDRGDSYETVVFAFDDAQASAAEASRNALEARKILPGPIVTPIEKIDRFWPAENYHQDFHEKNPGRYLPYRMGCGRDIRVAEVWKGEG